MRYAGRPGSPTALSFAGGNPDDSIHRILNVLSHMPSFFKLPIVWQTNGYSSPTTLKIISAISDVIVVSFKFSEGCAEKMGAPPNCLSVSLRNLGWLTANAPPTLLICRILLLPGHLDCCFSSIVDALQPLRHALWLTLLPGYVPVYKARGEIGRFLRDDEVEKATNILQKAQFQLTDSWIKG